MGLAEKGEEPQEAQEAQEKRPFLEPLVLLVVPPPKTCCRIDYNAVTEFFWRTV
jgi:hypothetical protein